MTIRTIRGDCKGWIPLIANRTHRLLLLYLRFDRMRSVIRVIWMDGSCNRVSDHVLNISAERGEGVTATWFGTILRALHLCHNMFDFFRIACFLSLIGNLFHLVLISPQGILWCLTALISRVPREIRSTSWTNCRLMSRTVGLESLSVLWIVLRYIYIA